MHHLLANIPTEFRGGYWAVVTLDTFDGKPNKNPLHPLTGNQLNVRFPTGGVEERPSRYDKGTYKKEWSAWSDFDTCAAKVAAGHGYRALGKLLRVEDGFTVLDVDHLDADKLGAERHAAMLQMQRDLFNETLPTYTERSVSGKGGHIIVRAHLPGGRRGKGLEIYGHDRFMICTGDVLTGRNVIIPRQDVVNGIIDAIGGLRSLPEIDVSEAELRNVHLTADELLAAVLKARNGARARELFEVGYASPPPEIGDGTCSSYDASFIERLCWFEPSFAAVLEVWERSALWRPGHKRNGDVPLYESYLQRTYTFGIRKRREAKAREAAMVEATAGPFLSKLPQWLPGQPWPPGS